MTIVKKIFVYYQAVSRLSITTSSRSNTRTVMKKEPTSIDFGFTMYGVLEGREIAGTAFVFLNMLNVVYQDQC